MAESEKSKPNPTKSKSKAGAQKAKPKTAGGVRAEKEAQAGRPLPPSREMSRQDLEALRNRLRRKFH